MSGGWAPLGAAVVVLGSLYSVMPGMYSGFGIFFLGSVKGLAALVGLI